MNYYQLMNAHKGIIYLFLLVYTIKVILMFVNDDLFQKVRAKTKVSEMILGTLIIGSGVTLIFMSATVEAWLIIKITLVLVAIGMAIVGLKKGNKVLAVLALVIFVYCFMIAIKKSATLSYSAPKTENQMVYQNFDIHPVSLSKTECVSFHGLK